MAHNLPEPFTTEVFTPARFASCHRIALKSGDCAFRTVSEDCVFYDPSGAPEATIFSISYLGDVPDTAERPVLFLWNGGPGSATSMLHLECFGPWQIARDEQGEAKYALTEDADCLIDVCDLVFVDPVGVGYSRLLNPEKASKYYSVDGDARSVAFFLTEWLRRHNRWESPVYLCGESYGTVRALRVLAELGRSPFSESRMVLGLPVAGVALIGLATSQAESETELTVAMMPAMAATNWFHRPDGKGDQDQFVKEAWDFARTRLLPALFDGDACADAERAAVAERLQYFTGIPKEHYIASGLKLGSAREFLTDVLPGYVLDLYDARLKKKAADYSGDLGDANVPIRVMNGLIAPKLGIGMPRLYYTGNINVNVQFDMETEDVDPAYKKTHMDCLRAAMKANPGMRTLFASGLYDLCTHAGNTRYVACHAGLPMERVALREYKGGHGVYSTPEGKSAFLADMRKLILGA